MSALLHWLGVSVPRFLAVAGAAYALVAFLAIVPSWRPRWWNSGPVFAAALLLALLAVRWPSTAFNAHLFNPDESQALAGAMAYERDLAPWRSVDLHTSGPLSAYALLAFAKLTGRALDFTTARLLALFCLWGSIVGLWRTLRTAGTETAARTLVLPLIPVLGATFSDIAQFNHEHLPVLLMAAALGALSPLLRPDTPLARWRLVAAGLALGAAPLAKLQAAPPAAWLGLAALVLLARRPASPGARLAACGWLTMPALLPLTALAFACRFSGTLDLAIDAYLGNNAAYLAVREFPVTESLTRLLAMAHTTTTLGFVLWPALVALPIGLALVFRFGSPSRRLFWLSAGWFGVSIAAAMLPGRMYYHYLLFVLCPAVALTGSVILGVASARPARWTGRGRVGIWIAWAAGALLPAVSGIHRAVALEAPFFGGFAVQRTQLATDILSIAEPGDRLGIWGWAPRLHVETGLAPATREAHTEREIETWGDREVYRRRYFAELRRTRPAVFLDTTGPRDSRYHDPAAHGVGSFPALAAWLGRHYELVAEIDGARIYLRRSRIAKLAAPHADLASLRPAMDPPPLGFAGASFNLNFADGHTVVVAPLPCRFDWSAATDVRVCQVRFGAADSAGNPLADTPLTCRAIASGGEEPYELPARAPSGGAILHAPETRGLRGQAVENRADVRRETEVRATNRSHRGDDVDTPIVRPSSLDARLSNESLRLSVLEFVVPADAELALEFAVAPVTDGAPACVRVDSVSFRALPR